MNARVPHSPSISRLFNSAKGQAPYFASIKFRDFERKLGL